MIEFCQQLICTPALSGDEEAIGIIYVTEMKRLGYDQAFFDPWGNVIGVVEGS
ncbi:MAG: hypothetical protein RSD88_01305 [Anaerovoracaceae bacterium]